MTTLSRLDSLPPVTRGLFRDVGYEPTAGQLPILQCQNRFILVTGGIQSGKTETLSKKFADKWNLDMAHWQPCVLIEQDPGKCAGHDKEIYPHLTNGKCDPTLIYWLVGSEYIMCEEEYNRIFYDLIALGLDPKRASRVDAPGWIEVKFPDEQVARLRIDVKSESRPDRAFSRVSPHGIMACEAGQLTYNTYQHMNTRTIGKAGWLFLSGTIEKAQPWYPAMSDAWSLGEDGKRSFQLPTYSNTHLFPGGELDPEIVRMRVESSDDFYMERIAGKPVPPEGLVFTEFNIGIHVQEDVVYIPGQEVYIFVDPGFAGYHALEIAHKIEGQYRFFDEFHEKGALTSDVIHWCSQQTWWQDAQHLAIDPYYKDVHHSVGSIAERWVEDSHLTPVPTERMMIHLSDERLEQYLHVNPLTKRPGVVFSPLNIGIISEFGAIPSPHSGTGEIMAYRNKIGDNGLKIGKNPIPANCDGIRAVEAGITYFEGMGGLDSKKRAVTRRGGQPIASSMRRRKLPHERYRKTS